MADSTPGGLITAEVSGWTGKIIAAPRSRLNQLLAREEASNNGVYLLLGDDPVSINSTWCYIGRTENFTERLRNHQAKKSQWDRVVIISSLHHSFNEGHWGYMEARLINAARAAQRCSLDENKNNPQGRRLSEAQEAAVESFYEQVKIVLPLLSVDILRSADQPAVQSTPPSAQSPVFGISRPKRKIDALLKVVDGEYFLLEGSTVAAKVNLRGRTESTLRTAKKIAASHQKLIDDGSLTIEGAYARVIRDLPFSSPSAASNIVLGTSTNGRTEWATPTGQTLGDWEATQS
ncbi:GIY-YIG nuclease family protein [Arcanobacterium canis]